MGFKFVQMKDILEWQNCENKFDEIWKTTGPISIKLGTKLSWVVGIQVGTNKGLSFFSKGG